MENKYNQYYYKLSKGEKYVIMNISYVVTISIPENIKMLGGDLRGKEDSDIVHMRTHPVLCQCLLFPFHRNKGNPDAHPGQCNRLHRKGGSREAKVENALYPLQEEETQRQPKAGNYEKVSCFSFFHFRNYASVESELINIHCKRQAYSS